MNIVSASKNLKVIIDALVFGKKTSKNYLS